MPHGHWKTDSITLLVEPGLRIAPGSDPAHVGVPFSAIARLILIYLQSEALRTGSRDVELGGSLRPLAEEEGTEPVQHWPSPGGERRQICPSDRTSFSATVMLVARRLWPSHRPAAARSIILCDEASQPTIVLPVVGRQRKVASTRRIDRRRRSHQRSRCETKAGLVGVPLRPPSPPG